MSSTWMRRSHASSGEQRSAGEQQGLPQLWIAGQTINGMWLPPRGPPACGQLAPFVWYRPVLMASAPPWVAACCLPQLWACGRHPAAAVPHPGGLAGGGGGWEVHTGEQFTDVVLPPACCRRRAAVMHSACAGAALVGCSLQLGDPMGARSSAFCCQAPLAHATRVDGAHLLSS